MRKLFYLLSILITNFLIAQGTELPKVISPSPNVAALQKYGEIPVSNYTGVPNNNIPLYTIKSEDIEVPISISYHSSGIKVTDEASWVGLGWALNAGGVITRQVRGRDDFGSGGYLTYGMYTFPPQSNTFTIIGTYQKIKFAVGLPPSSGVYPPSIHEILTPEMKAFTGGYISSQALNPSSGLDAYGFPMELDVLVGPQDGEPDVYHFNFLGHSGKLLLNKNGAGGLKIVSTEDDQLNFSYNIDTKKWTVKDVKGFEYEFGVLEYSRSRQSTCRDSNDYLSETNITGWYINKIKSPKGDEITFEYLYDSTLIGGVSVTSQNGIEEQGNLKWKKMPAQGDTRSYLGVSAAGTPCSSSNSDIYRRTIKNYTESYEKYLKRINFKEGYVDFNMDTTNRKDRLIGYNPENKTSGALNNIIIYNKNNEVIDKIIFNTDYFNADKINLTNKQDYLRLKLNEITLHATSNNPQKYRFQYSDITLPPKDTYSVDSWGYYNGANNTNIVNYELYATPLNSYSLQIFGNSYARNNLSTLIPSYDYFDNDIIVNMNGADRNPNKDFIQAGILKTIYYPTGGKTKFEYEPNTYYKSDGKGVSETSYFASALGVNETSFSIQEKAFVKIEYRFDNNTGYGQETESSIYNKIWNTYVALERQDGTKKIRFFPVRDFSNPNYPAPDGTFTKHTLSYFTVLLEPGTYKLKANNGGFVYFTLDLKAIVQNKYTSSISVNQLGAGLRVKSIQNIDGTGKIEEKQFSYTEDDGRSSGNIMSPIFNFYSATSYMEAFMSNPPSIPRYTDMESAFITSLKNPIYKLNQPISNYIEASGSSFLPLGNSAAGQSIGYNQVTITNVDPFPFSTMKNLGRSVFKYNNYPDTLYGTIVPYVKKDKQHDENGQLTYEYHYDRTNRLVSEKQYTYSMANTFKVDGLRVMTSSSPYCFINPLGTNNVELPSPPCHEMVKGVLFDRFYEDEIHWWTPNQVIEKTYPVGGGTPIVTTKIFFYENLAHKQLTKEQTIFPDATIQKTYRYADEESNQLMKTKNMIGIPLVDETQKTSNGTAKTLQKVEIYYPKDSSETVSTNGLALPLWTKTYGLDNLTTPNTFLTYDKYDPKGNILQYSEKGLKPTAFIWGYNYTLPIAKIEGIGYDALMAISGISTAVNSMVSKSDVDKDQTTENDLIVALDAFRTNPILANYQISTYTYNPMIGLTSVTPPSGIREIYKYDDTNRLSRVIDIDGNVLKENKYNYSNTMASDVNTIGEILGNGTVGIFTGQNSQETYNYFTKNMPGYYYWYTQPTEGVTVSNLNNSSIVNLTFNSNSQPSYTLYGTGLNTTTGENVTLEKKINVYNITYPAYGSPNLTALPNIQIATSGIYVNGTTVSGYFVFKPGIFTGTKDFALISSDKAPSVNRPVNFHELGTGINRQWIFTFKTNGVVTASYSGTPLANDSVINVSSFSYQK